MSYGYTTRIDRLNTEATPTLGVKLGRVCIKKDVPVSEVASRLGVSRQTIYNWFMGTHEPNEELTETIKELITEYR
jgi:DNA-binding XRE family transcriptional regulator